MAEAFVRLASSATLESVVARPESDQAVIGGHTVSVHDMALRPPVQGTVYGVLLNTRSQYGKLEPKMHEPPYGAPPVAPVLYIKTRNTHAADNDAVAIPAGEQGVLVEGSIGMVLARPATRVRQDEAMDYVLGYTLVCDITVPHAQFFRPPLKFRCRDGFCPMGPWIVARKDAPDPAGFRLDISIDGKLAHSENFADLMRSPAKLLADVTEFLTLDAGDVLLLGGPGDAPLARVGQRIEISAPGLGSLRNTLVAESL